MIEKAKADEATPVHDPLGQAPWIEATGTAAGVPLIKLLRPGELAAEDIERAPTLAAAVERAERFAIATGADFNVDGTNPHDALSVLRVLEALITRVHIAIKSEFAGEVSR